MTRPALLLTAVLVLAGCSLPVGPGTPTPAHVAPGVTESGLANASALAAANDRSLRGGFTLARTYTDRIPDHDDYRIDHETTVRVGAEFERFHLVTNTRARRNGTTNYTTETWSNGSVVFTRFANATATRYERHDPDRFAYGPTNLTHASAVRALRDGTLTRLGDGRYRLAYSQRTRGAGTRNATREGSATFDSEGRVYETAVDAAFDTRVGRSYVTETVRWHARGETTVPRPSWHDAAVNATQSR